MMKKLILSALLVSALTFSASQAHAVIMYQQAMNMTGFWDFNGPNPLADRTGHGNTLTTVGTGQTYTTATASLNGWAPAELFGTPATPGDVARVANLNGGNGFNMPGGIYTGGDFTFIIAQRRPSNDGSFKTLLGTNRFRYQNVNDNLQGDINSPGGSFGGSSPMANQNWYFVALTYNNTTKGISSFKATNTTTLGPPVLTGSAAGIGLSNITALQIGIDNVSGIGGADGFNGQIDFIAFDNSALNSSQLQGMLNDFVNGAVSVPEPSSLALLSLGVIGMAVRAQRRRRAAA